MTVRSRSRLAYTLFFVSVLVRCIDALPTIADTVPYNNLTHHTPAFPPTWDVQAAGAYQKLWPPYTYIFTLHSPYQPFLDMTALFTDCLREIGFQMRRRSVSPSTPYPEGKFLCENRAETRYLELRLVENTVGFAMTFEDLEEALGNLTGSLGDIRERGRGVKSFELEVYKGKMPFATRVLSGRCDTKVVVVVGGEAGEGGNNGTGIFG